MNKIHNVQGAIAVEKQPKAFHRHSFGRLVGSLGLGIAMSLYFLVTDRLH